MTIAVARMPKASAKVSSIATPLTSQLRHDTSSNGCSRCDGGVREGEPVERQAVATLVILLQPPHDRAVRRRIEPAAPCPSDSCVISPSFTTRSPFLKTSAARAEHLGDVPVLPVDRDVGDARRRRDGRDPRARAASPGAARVMMAISSSVYSRSIEASVESAIAAWRKRRCHLVAGVAVHQQLEDRPDRR